MSKKYVHQEYPKFKHHATEAPVVVHSEAEEKELGAEWKDHPHEMPSLEALESHSLKSKHKPKAKPLDEKRGKKLALE